MATKQFFSYIEIQYNKLSTQIDNWLKSEFNRSDIQLNSASPYGQVMTVQKETFTHNMLYFKNIVNQFDIENAIKDKTIRTIATIAGHNPSRAISAIGTLVFKLKAGTIIDQEVKGGAIVITEGTELKNKTNNLSYSLSIGADQNVYSLTPNCSFYINVFQGKYETQNFTGDGTSLQSISVNIPNGIRIDNFNFTVKYNGQMLSVKDHLLDMLPGEMACYTRTGYLGGLDVFFGNDNNGFKPFLGSSIDITYLITDGNKGDIFNPQPNDWKFVGDVTDMYGNIVDMSKLFNIDVYIDINFSSNGETKEFTKAIIPYVSRNFVLSGPNQFIYHLKRMNMFSKINAFNKLDDNNFQNIDLYGELNNFKRFLNTVYNSDYLVNSSSLSSTGGLLRSQTGAEQSLSINAESNSKANIINTSKIQANITNLQNVISNYERLINDNQIYLYLIPDIKNYFTDTVNYFNIPIDYFYLDEIEQAKVLSYLKRLGTINMTSEINIIQPTIQRYVVHVYIRRFDYETEENLRQNIITSLSEHFLTSDRIDRIVKADIVSDLKTIKGIDSVDIHFVSKKNEDFHVSNPKNSLVLGLDPVLGDVVIEKDEYPLIRGGWIDRNGIYYSDDINSNSMCTINIVFNGVTPSK